MNKGSDLEFYEVQRFRNPWIRFSIVALTVGFLIYFGLGVYKQIICGVPWGTKPLSNFALILTGCLILTFMLGLCFFFFSLKLITMVNQYGVYVKLFPISQQKIPFENIVSCQPTTYNPIQDYGGWGVRYGKKGKAYTIYGNKGVELELADTSRLLIGSQRPEDLSRSIEDHIQ